MGNEKTKHEPLNRTQGVVKPARQGSVKYFHAAKSEKNDEFYTILSDIEKELKHYKRHFKDRVVFCNCDDPKESNFVKFFSMNFEHFGLKKLVATHYKGANLFTREPPYKLEYTGTKRGKRLPDPNDFLKAMIGTGDFRSAECIELLKQAHIVVTNPPFSLFREYVAQLEEYGKKFLIVANWSAVTYKEVFKLIKENKIWIGMNSNRNFSGFIVPKYYPLRGTEARIDEHGNRIVSSNNTCWFTNLDIAKRHEDLVLYKTYNPAEYPKYDNYDAIEVSNTKEIPMDYAGVMGVPVTFLDKHNPESVLNSVGGERRLEAFYATRLTTC
jgi:Adenine-specific methyltransferase EcoRI